MLLIATACKPSEGKMQQSTTQPKGLAQEWIRSPEEDDLQKGMIYRPSTYKFPPSRGRESMNLKSDGALIYRKIAPTDGIDTFNGTWTFDHETNILTLYISPESIQKYNLIWVDFDKLAIQLILK